MLVAARAARAARAACAWIGWVAGSCLTPELSRRRPLVGHPQKNRFLSDESRSHSHGFGRQHCKVTHIPLRPREVARTCARNGSSGKSVSGSFAHEETDTARTRRTRHGSLRCREKRLVREKQNDCRLTTTAAADATSRQSEACPAAERSVLVRCVRAVSALCPLLHGRRRRNLRHPNSNGSRPRTAVHEPSVRHPERGIAGGVAPIPPTPSRCAPRLRPPHSPDRCLTPTPWPRARRARASLPRSRRRLRPSPY